MPLNDRAAILRRLADLLDENADEIAAINTKELGKPISMSRIEVFDAANLLRGHTEKALHAYGDVLGQNANPADLIFTRREAVGVVGCIIPFNYPIELTYQKLAPALICGNACLVKVPSSNPLSVLSTAKYIEQAGIPKNVVQIFAAERDVVDKAIIKNPKVAAIAMTGSSPAGAYIAEKAGGTLKRLMLELGGNDPFIVFDDVDPKLAAQEIAGGRWENNGQICCGAKRFIVHKDIKDRVIAELIEVLKGWKVGDPMEEDTVVSYLVSEAAAKAVEAQVSQTVSEGAKLVWGNGRTGARFEPVILDNVTRDMAIASNMEIFAMVFPVISFETEEEAVEIANNTEFGLSSGVLSGDTLRAFRVAEQIKAGATVVNGNGCYRIYEQAFGGPKMTGIGREGISCGIDEFSVVKTYIVKGAFSK
jgi:succinate-semialdehyde dehydrogenase/glutarate-semialdehyde dehydrogenase